MGYQIRRKVRARLASFLFFLFSLPYSIPCLPLSLPLSPVFLSFLLYFLPLSLSYSILLHSSVSTLQSYRIVASRTQIPLMLAWAVSVHKVSIYLCLHVDSLRHWLPYSFTLSSLTYCSFSWCRTRTLSLPPNHPPNSSYSPLPSPPLT